LALRRVRLFRVGWIPESLVTNTSEGPDSLGLPVIPVGGILPKRDIALYRGPLPFLRACRARRSKRFWPAIRRPEQRTERQSGADDLFARCASSRQTRRQKKGKSRIGPCWPSGPRGDVAVLAWLWPRAGAGAAIRKIRRTRSGIVEKRVGTLPLACLPRPSTRAIPSSG